jgi:hypothetical protein
MLRMLRTHCQKHHKLYTTLFLLALTVQIAACTASWVSEAVNIINLIVPAIEAALGILTAFGMGLSPSVLTSVQAWATDATNSLVNVVTPLINQYNTAEATAKPGILTEIQTALNVIVGNLKSILPAIKVTDPATQAKITAVVGAIADELTALVNLVPAIQGTVTSHAELKALVGALKSPGEFKADFNAKAGAFGPQYQIK